MSDANAGPTLWGAAAEYWERRGVAEMSQRLYEEFKFWRVVFPARRAWIKELRESRQERGIR